MKKFLYLFFVGILLLFSNADVKAYAYPDNGANKFMFTVNPFLEGKSESGKFEILTHPDENYSYTVEW